MKEILYEIQVLKNKQSLTKTIKWLQKNNYKWNKLVITKNFYRFVIKKFKDTGDTGNLIDNGIVFRY